MMRKKTGLGPAAVTVSTRGRTVMGAANHFTLGAAALLLLSLTAALQAGVPSSSSPAAADAAEPASVVWHVDPITIKVPPDRREPFASSQRRINLAGQRGECEKTQVWLSAADMAAELVDIRVTFSGAPANWTAMQQGYVRCSPPGAGGPGWQGYTCLDQEAGDNAPHSCKEGWYPDPLFPAAANGSIVPLVPAGRTQPIFIQACIPSAATPGNFTGEVAVAGRVGNGSAFRFTVPWTLEVWPITLPALDHVDSFRAAIGNKWLTLEISYLPMNGGTF